MEREHAPLAKGLFHSIPPRAHPVVEPHACSNTIVELTNDQFQILWHTKTGEYCPEEGSRSTESYALVRSTMCTHNGICFFRSNSCSRQIANIISVVERFGRKPLCFSGRIPKRSQYSLRRRAVVFSSIFPLHKTLQSVPIRLTSCIRSTNCDTNIFLLTKDLLHHLSTCMCDSCTFSVPTILLASDLIIVKLVLHTVPYNHGKRFSTNCA